MRKLAVASLIFLSPLAQPSTFNTEVGKGINVIFIPQAHRNPVAPSAYDDDVAKSQFEVLRAISEYPGATVFAEGYTFDQTQYDAAILSQSFERLEVSKVFPKVPQHFAELTIQQRKTLYRLSAVTIAAALGLVSKVKATDSHQNIEEDFVWLNTALSGSFSSKEQQAKHIQDLLQSTEYKSRIMIRRENEAFDRIRKYTESDQFKNEPLLLAFGAAHNFERHSTESIRVRSHSSRLSCGSSFE